MKKILLVFGTRPEAIKMCPLVSELKSREGIRTAVCVTGQHKEMLNEVLSAFSVVPDYDLSVMKENQTLFDVTAAVLTQMEAVLEKEKPELVLVHGDTTSAFSAALACFYKKIPVGHVEAGLRTYDIQSPYPEEFNRRSVTLLSSLHFAPTEAARSNLLSEGVSPARVFVTGNTAVDALKTTVREDYTHPALLWAKGTRLLLFTAHRRESHGAPLRAMLRAARKAVEQTEDVSLLFPMHKSPAVQKAARETLAGCPRVWLSEPLGVCDFHNLLARSYLVLTDSGGVQEEAAALSLPTLVMREVTERPEGVSAGALSLVGTSEEGIYQALMRLLTDKNAYARMTKAKNPYGDGNASRRIADILEGK